MVQTLVKYEVNSARVKGLAFHPRRSWILASLHTGVIQWWDYEEKTLVDTFKGHNGPVRGIDFHRNQPLFVSGGDDTTIRLWNYKSRKCVFTIDAHEDYVRTTFFHHENPWIVSSSDDSSIRIWNWQSRTRIAVLTGHTNYVKCAKFHPTRNMLLSASTDQTLRLWDLTSMTIKKDTKDDVTGMPEILTRSEYTVESKDAHMQGLNWCEFHPTKDLCLSTSEDSYIKVWRVDPRMGLSELYTLRGHYSDVNCAIFDPLDNYIISVSDDRSLKIWDMDKRAAIVTRRKDIEKFWVAAAHSNRHLFVAGHDTGLMIFKSKRERPKAAKIDKFGIEKFPGAKQVVTSLNKKLQAYIGRDDDSLNWIKICDNQNVLCKITEFRKVKSAKWDASGVLIYNTPVHVKYALSDGHTTTILSVQETLYIVDIKDNKIHCLNRKGQTRQIPIDPREFEFKQAVVRGDRAKIMTSLRQLKTLSRAEIAFLVKKGYPSLALKFVKDAESRFPLAIKAHKIDEALEDAIKINRVGCWQTLADAAIEIGHVKATERALIELKQPYRLAILYYVCDQPDKMILARSLAKEMGDTSTEFTISLLLKDFAQCAQIMRRFYPNLAYACAVNHGLYELAMEISQELTEEQLGSLPSLESAYSKKVSWMQQSMRDVGLSKLPFENWPLLEDDDEEFEPVLANDDDEDNGEVYTANQVDGDWDDEESKLSSERDADDQLKDIEDVEEEAGWSDGEPLEDLVDDDDSEIETTTRMEPKEKTKFMPPNPGTPITVPWTKLSNVALHHVLAGSFKSAFSLLERHVGVVSCKLEDGKTNLDVLNKIFCDLYIQSKAAYQGSPLLSTYYAYPVSGEPIGKHHLPAGGYSIEELEKDLKECHDLVTKGKFKEAIESFRILLVRCLFLQVGSNPTESVERAIEIIGISREYILALQVWGERKRITEKDVKDFEDHKRACELAAYFAKLKLARRHRHIVLEQALKVFRARPKEFQKTHAAAVIARRLLEILDNSDAKKKDVIAFAERVKSSEDVQVDQELNLDYDDKNPYSLCAATFKPIYKGHQSTECPLCDAKYRPQYASELCRVCQLSEIGRHSSGINLEVTKD